MSFRRFLAASILAALCTWLTLPMAAADLQALARLADSGDLQGAESGLREHLAQGEDPVARDLLGMVLTRQSRFGEAEEQFRKALEANPQLLPSYQHLARLQLSQDRPEEALTTLRRAAEIGPLERELAFYLAGRELEAGGTERAEAQLFSLAQRFDSPRALHQLAQLRWRQGAIGEAATLLRQALELAPNSTALLDTYARLSLARRQPVYALIALEGLERMHPANTEYTYLLGVARLQVGDMTGALESLELATERSPDRSLAWAALGLTLNHLKRYDEARDALDRSLSLTPDSSEALAALAEAQAGLGEKRTAEANARRALARDPEQATAHLVLGMLHLEEGRHQAAVDELQQSVEHSTGPSSAKAHYQLSQAYARLGDAEASRRHVELYRQALEQQAALLAEIRGPALAKDPNATEGAPGS
jgi:tetratricopeptide (TPR) repeat protein